MWGKPNRSILSASEKKAQCKRSRANLLKRFLLGSIFIVLIFWTITMFEKNEERGLVDISSLPGVHFQSRQIVGNPPSDFYNAWFCDVQCSVSQPCEYKDEVDLRIIVMTFQRHKSLEKCLGAIYHMDNLGDKVSVEIWVDRSKNGSIDGETLKVAESFVDKWSRKEKKGRACIHKQVRNAYIGGQWIDTWRPKESSRELGLILEDDVSISPHAYRWIKAAHAEYGARSDIAGYTLQMEGTNFFAPLDHFRPMDVDLKQTAFMYPVLGTWGFAPHPRAWRKFQEWYHTMRPNCDIRTDHITPRVPGMEADKWYGFFQSNGRQETMWEMWHIRFSHDKKLFTLYSNMKRHLDRKDIVLSSNRMEKGLHYTGDGVDNTGNLLTSWIPEFVDFPSKVLELNYDGTLCTEKCCFETSCKGFFRSLFSKK